MPLKIELTDLLRQREICHPTQIQSAEFAGLTAKDDDASLESCAIAAAEVVAAIHDGDISRLPENARKALEKYKSDVEWSTLVPIACIAIERIMVESELRELWADVDEVDDWLSDLASLKTRLKA